MKVIVTAGPTHEPIDPVRFIGNRSSGKQGYAIANALKNAGYDVSLISGPTHLYDIEGVNMTRIETAKQMLEATLNALPADIIICSAAVADWTPIPNDHKIKKGSGEPQIKLIENPDILKTIANHKDRPRLVIGFAAETQNLIENATAKLDKKNCDWILANEVGNKDKKVFGEDENHVYLITRSNQEDWKTMSKTDIAQKLVDKITTYFSVEKK